MRTHQRTALLALVATTAALAVPVSAAQGKTWTASTTDQTGDSPAPGRDITDVKFRYKSNGSVLFVVTVAAPIDGAASDAVVTAGLGPSCKKIQLTGGGLFSQPDPVAFSKITGKKISKPREGKGEITGNVYTLSVKHSSFKNWKPGCFAVALVDPATVDADEPTVFDETDEIKVK